MARFALREFATPHYAEFIPVTPMEERPVEQIEKFMTFLNEIPWFPKKEEGEDSSTKYNENMENSQAEKPEHEQTMRESVKTREDKKMEGYTPNDFDYGEASELYNKDASNVTRDPREQRIAENPLGSRAGGDRGPAETGPDIEQALLDAYRKRISDDAANMEGYRPLNVR